MSDFTEIFLSTRKLLTDVVAKIVPHSEVEDIVQDTFVKAHVIEDKDRIEKPAAFMVKIAKNLAFDYIKSARHKTSCDADDELFEHLQDAEQNCFGDSTCRKVASQRDFELFCSEVKKLPEKCRQVFIMKKIYGYSQKEISEKEGIAISTVEKHIAYGTKRLFHLMKNQLDIEMSVGNNASRKASVLEECS